MLSISHTPLQPEMIDNQLTASTLNQKVLCNRAHSHAADPSHTSYNITARRREREKASLREGGSTTLPSTEGRAEDDMQKTQSRRAPIQEWQLGAPWTRLPAVTWAQATLQLSCSSAQHSPPPAPTASHITRAATSLYCRGSEEVNTTSSKLCGSEPGLHA